MKVMELIEQLSSLPQYLDVLAVDCNGNSTRYVMIKKLIGQVEITGFPEPKPYDTHDYDDIMPGPYNGDFLRGMGCAVSSTRPTGFRVRSSDEG